MYNTQKIMFAHCKYNGETNLIFIKKIKQCLLLVVLNVQ
ncbi:hypothetical protein AB08_3574 [Escherichia coli 5-366-08_S1_C1]|nr:hypothetical protein AB67_4117 [Escherichia coli 5-366-08_S1_C3]KEL67943.1 hypothetical protein AB08_3574 [Escherichia coli 5-366-08_S1_C1]